MPRPPSFVRASAAPAPAARTPAPAARGARRAAAGFSRRTTAGIGVTVLLAAVLVGCGGSDEAPTAQSSATAAPATSSAPSAAPASPVASPAAGAYVDADGFSIVFPENWKVQADIAGLQVLGAPPEQTDPEFSDNVGVLLEATGREGLTAAEYVEASVQNAPQLIPDFTLVERDDEAGILEYTGTVQDRELHFLARAVVNPDGKAFTATFTATAATFEDGRKAARTVLDSLTAA